MAIVVAAAALLVSAGPGALAQVADQEVRHTLAGYSATRHDLTASASFGSANAGSQDPSDAEARFGAITTTVDGVVDGVLPPLASLLGTPQWGVVTTRSFAAVRDDPSPAAALVLGLAATPHWRELVNIVEGAAPTAWAGSDEDVSVAASRIPVPVALSRAAADQMKVAVGDILDIGPRSVVVTGLYDPADADDTFWEHGSLLREAAKGRADDGRIAFTADALIDPARRRASEDVPDCANPGVVSPPDR